MSLDRVFAELRIRAEQVPIPPRLPTSEELANVERQIGLSFSPDYRRFLLESSDIVLGTLEPATVTNAACHTYLPKVVASAREYGVPQHLLPICEDNADFYCLAPSGEVQFWSHDGVVEERWPSLAAWLTQVWLGERA